ncbi:MAG: DUF1992 domain-containing protein [Bacteroidota bacterium]
MSLDHIAEAIIQEAMARGEFDGLRGKGKPLDLTQYFETPEELRVAYSVLKNAGMLPEEINLLREIGELRERLGGTTAEPERHRLRGLISERQMQYNMLMERRKK